MKRKIIFIILVMFILGGMNNARQLNDLAIVSAIGVDMNEKGEYIITSQILNPKKENSSGSGGSSSKESSDIVVYNSTSMTVQNAIRNIVDESPRKLYLAHMELLLISEKVARQANILDTLDFFIRNNEGSNDFMLVITKGTNPQKVLEILTPLETNPAKNIKDSISATNEYKGICTDKTLSENMSMFLKDGQGAVLTSIEVDYGNEETENSKVLEEENKKTESEEDEKEKNEDEKLNSEKKTSKSSDEKENQKDVGKSSGNKEMNNKTNLGQEDSSDENKSQFEQSSNVKIKVSYLGYFKDKSLSGYLDNDTSLIYNLLNNNLETGIMQAEEGDDKIVVDIVKSKVKKIPKKENDEYKMDLKIDITCNLAENGKNVKFDSNENIEKYQKQIEDKIKKKVEEFLKLSQEKYECDLMAYGITFYKHRTKDYYEFIEKYGKDEYFKYISTNIDVKVKFLNQGGIYNIW